MIQIKSLILCLFALDSVHKQWLIIIITLHHINWGDFCVLFLFHQSCNCFCQKRTKVTSFYFCFLDASRKLCAQLGCLQTCFHLAIVAPHFLLSRISYLWGWERKKWGRETRMKLYLPNWLTWLVYLCVLHQDTRRQQQPRRLHDESYISKHTVYINFVLRVIYSTLTVSYILVIFMCFGNLDKSSEMFIIHE